MPEQLALAQLKFRAVVLVFEMHTGGRVVSDGASKRRNLKVRERTVEDGGLVASGECLVAPLGEYASRALVAEELHTAIDKFVVVRERNAGLQFAFQRRVGATLRDDRPS